VASTSIPQHRQHNALVTARAPCRPASSHPYTYSQPQRAQHVFMPEMHTAAPDECEWMSPKRPTPRSPPPRSVPSTRVHSNPLCLYVCAHAQSCLGLTSHSHLMQHSGRASSSYANNQAAGHDPLGNGGRDREIPSPHARGSSDFGRSGTASRGLTPALRLLSTYCQCICACALCERRLIKLTDTRFHADASPPTLSYDSPGQKIVIT
jgi:hypothetical protein